MHFIESAYAEILRKISSLNGPLEATANRLTIMLRNANSSASRTVSVFSSPSMRAWVSADSRSHSATFFPALPDADLISANSASVSRVATDLVRLL